jgi:hypothetical protein
MTNKTSLPKYYGLNFNWANPSNQTTTTGSLGETVFMFNIKYIITSYKFGRMGMLIPTMISNLNINYNPYVSFTYSSDTAIFSV